MEKSTILAIGIFFVILLIAFGAGLYFKVIDFNAIKAKITGKAVVDQNDLVAIYLSATDKLMKDYRVCIDKCPENSTSLDLSCVSACEKTHAGKDYVARELKGTNFTEADVNSKAFYDQLQSDKRVYPLIAKLNCITACNPKTKKCIDNCIK